MPGRYFLLRYCMGPETEVSRRKANFLANEPPRDGGPFAYGPFLLGKRLGGEDHVSARQFPADDEESEDHTLDAGCKKSRPEPTWGRFGIGS